MNDFIPNKNVIKPYTKMRMLNSSSSIITVYSFSYSNVLVNLLRSKTVANIIAYSAMLMSLNIKIYRKYLVRLKESLIVDKMSKLRHIVKTISNSLREKYEMLYHTTIYSAIYFGVNLNSENPPNWMLTHDPGAIKVFSRSVKGPFQSSQILSWSLTTTL